MRVIVEMNAARGIPEGNSYECEFCQEKFDAPEWVADVSFDDDSESHVCFECLQEVAEDKKEGVRDASDLDV